VDVQAAVAHQVQGQEEEAHENLVGAKGSVILLRSQRACKLALSLVLVSPSREAILSPLCSWLQIQRSRVIFPVLTSNQPWTGSTQPREYNWGVNGVNRVAEKFRNKWLPLCSSGQSSWLQVQRSGFDSY
jgi:hypothetical protein